MAQRIINIGTVANDGTGETLRGAFANTNNNFTELYNNYTNVSTDLVTLSVASNAWSNAVATAGNNYSVAIGIASNTWANSIGTAGNNYSVFIGGSSNNWSNSISVLVGTAGNNYSVLLSASSNTWSNTISGLVGTAGNNYSISVGVASNTWANTVGIASNNYTVTVGLSSNTWANVVGTAGNSYTVAVGAASNSLTNLVGTAGNNYVSTVVFNQANQAFNAANNSLQNTSINLNGSMSAISFSDSLGGLRDSFVTLSSDNTNILIGSYFFVSNTSNLNYVDIMEDSVISYPVGATAYISQYGTGKTVIRPNTVNVKVYSSNGLNVAARYAVAQIVKIASNTWIAFGGVSTA